MYYKSSPANAKWAAARVLNLLIDAINKNKTRLPKFLLIVLDKDILEQFCDKSHVMAGKCVDGRTNWLTKQIKSVIAIKKQELFAKNPGAILPEYPKVIYIRMVRRINKFKVNSKPDQIYSLTSLFNYSLNDEVADQGHNIMTIMSCNSSAHFT